MRASQNINPGRNYRLTPAQRRLSAGISGPGMRFSARKSMMPRARKAEVIAAVTGSLVILSLVAGLLAL
ncbi:MAG: hypothetical protein AAFN92_08945 [Bacteroidota bacterium]